MTIIEEITKLRSSGFDKGSLKVKLRETMDKILIAQGLPRMTPTEAYAFYRGIEVTCDYLTK
jgi:hypothetical protein